MVSARPDAPTWGDGSARRRLVDAVTDTFAIIVTALRVLRRHWPVLLALALAGVAGHELAIRLAVSASKVSGEAGMLVLVLAPLSTLAAMVLMLRAVRPSLPGEVGGGASHPSVLGHLGSALIPFLTVYETYGYLTRDISDYAYRVFEDEVFNNPDVFTDPDAVDVLERMPYDLDLTNLVVIGLAVTLRWLLSRWQATETHAWLGIPGAYLEAVWITLVASATFNAVRGSVTDWVSERRIVHAGRDLWQDVVDRLGWLAEPTREVVNWLGEQVGHSYPVVVIPVAWLVIGAMVNGPRQLEAPRPRADLLPGRARAAWWRVPTHLRRVAWHLVGVRLAPMLHIVRLLLAAGPRPILLFCLAFVLTESLPGWLWEVERLLVGPRELQTVWIPLSWPLSTLNDSLARIVMICLVAAAVDRLLHLGAPALGRTAGGAAPSAAAQSGTSQA